MRKEFHSEEFAAKALGCSFWRKPSRSNWKMIDYSRIALNFARLSWCSYLSFIFIFVEVNRCIAAASATQRIREQYLQAGWWCREGNLFVHFIMWFYLTHKLLSALFGDGGYRRYVPLLVIVLDCLGGTLSDRGSGGSRPRRGNRRHRGCHFWWVWVVASEISSAFWLSLILKRHAFPSDYEAMGWSVLESGDIESLPNSPEFRARLESMLSIPDYDECDDLTQSSSEEQEVEGDAARGVSAKSNGKRKATKSDRPTKKQRTRICSFVCFICLFCLSVMWSHAQSLYFYLL